MFFQSLNSFKEVPAPFSIGLSSVPRANLSLSLCRILLEEFECPKKELEIDRVLSKVNPVLCRGIDLEIDPHFCKYTWLNAVPSFEVVDEGLMLQSFLSFLAHSCKLEAVCQHFFIGINKNGLGHATS